MDKNVDRNVGKQGVGLVSVKLKSGVENQTSEKLPITMFKGPTCNVGFSTATTKNLGNYENVKISVSLNIPCYQDEIDSVFKVVTDWVDTKMGEVLAEIGK